LHTRKAVVDAAVCLLLVASVFAVYGQTAGFGFINFDDDEYVYENPHVLGGLNATGVAWAFTHAETGAYWHPLTLISLMADVQVVGPNYGSPDLARLAAWMHLVNVALHAANAILLYLLLRWTTGTLWRSAVAAAIFAVHPLHVESVAWITERKDVLSGMFGLLAIAAYIWYARRPGLLRWLWVTVALALGLMCKPMLVTSPLVFLLLDFWPLGRWAGSWSGSREESPDRPHSIAQLPRHSLGWLLLEKVPLLPLVAASALVTFLLQRSNGAVADLNSVPVLERIARAAELYVAYIGKTLWPANLAPIYPMKPLASYWLAAGAALLLAVVTVCVLWLSRPARSVSRRWLAVGWFWYLVTLLPTIGLVQVGVQVMADRFLYLPQIGLCIILAWLLAGLAGPSFARRIAGSSAASVALLAFAACAARQAALWHDDVKLWQYTLNRTSGNFTAHLHLGLAFSARGEQDEAVKQYELALDDLPSFPEAHFNLAAELDALGRTDAARRHYESALEVRPNYLKARNNLGMLYFNQGDFAAAAEQFQKALGINPNYAMAQNNLGITLMARGQFAPAAERFRQAIALDPDFAQPHANLGSVLDRLGESAAAVDELREFLRRQPGNPKVLSWLADAYAETGDYAAAVTTAEAGRERATTTGQVDLAAELQQRIELYRRGQPFRPETPGSR
jgi:Flp pilus assembly protein TadD